MTTISIITTIFTLYISSVGVISNTTNTTDDAIPDKLFEDPFPQKIQNTSLDTAVCDEFSNLIEDLDINITLLRLGGIKENVLEDFPRIKILSALMEEKKKEHVLYRKMLNYFGKNITNYTQFDSNINIFFDSIKTTDSFSEIKSKDEFLLNKVSMYDNIQQLINFQSIKNENEYQRFFEENYQGKKSYREDFDRLTEIIETNLDQGGGTVYCNNNPTGYFETFRILLNHLLIQNIYGKTNENKKILSLLSRIIEKRDIRYFDTGIDLKMENPGTPPLTHFMITIALQGLYLDTVDILLDINANNILQLMLQDSVYITQYNEEEMLKYLLIGQYNYNIQIADFLGSKSRLYDAKYIRKIFKKIYSSELAQRYPEFPDLQYSADDFNKENTYMLDNKINRTIIKSILTDFQGYAERSDINALYRKYILSRITDF